MMRSLVLASLLVSSACVFAQEDRGRSFGKTNAQILAMGEEKWMDFFYKKSGGMSTAETNEALDVYRDAMAWRNDGLMSKSSSLKAKYLPLRAPLRKLVGESMQLTYVMSGGGSMYSNIAASLQVSAEELLYNLLRGKTASKSIADSVIDARLAKLIKGAKEGPSPELADLAKTASIATPKALSDVRKASAKFSAGQKRLLSGFLFNLIDPEPR
jgi:hypothetical protein